MSIDSANILFVMLSTLCLFSAAIFFSISSYSVGRQSRLSADYLTLASIYLSSFIYGMSCIGLEDFNQFHIYESGFAAFYCASLTLFFTQCLTRAFRTSALLFAFPLGSVAWLFFVNYTAVGPQILFSTAYLILFHLLLIAVVVLAYLFFQQSKIPIHNRWMIVSIAVYIGLISHLTPYVTPNTTLFWVIRTIDLALIAFILVWIVFVNSGLHKESVRFRLAFEQAQVAVVMLDSSNQITYQNNTFIERYNVLEYDNITDIPLLAKTISTVDKALESNESWHGEQSIAVGKNKISTQMFAHGLYNSSGAILLKVFSIVDTTKQTKYKLLLENYGEQLSELSAKLLDIQESERAKIARELHDDIGQQLTLLKFNIAAEAGLGDKSSLYSSVDNLLFSVRNLSRQLRPAILDELGLPSAIQWFIHQLDATQVMFKVDVDEHYIDITHPRDINFFRLVQEIVNNALKHANAKTISIRLVSSEDIIRLTIEDDGDGFNIDDQTKAAQSSGSLGLLSIKERVKLMHGTIVLESTKGAGTKYVIEAKHEAN